MENWDDQEELWDEEDEEEWEDDDDSPDEQLLRSIMEGNYNVLFDVVKSNDNYFVLEKIEENQEYISSLINCVDNKGRTVLHWAAALGNEIWTRIFLNQVTFPPTVTTVEFFLPTKLLFTK